MTLDASCDKSLYLKVSLTSLSYWGPSNQVSGHPESNFGGGHIGAVLIGGSVGGC